MESEQQQSSEMTCREAGRRGGRKCAETHGREHYRQIGTMGGSATSAKHGREHYERMGRKGGQRVKELIARAKQMEEGA